MPDDLVLRPKAVWRYGLGAMVVFALGGAIGQQQWEGLAGVPIVAMVAVYAWWARVEVHAGSIRVRRLRTWVFPLNRSTTATRTFVGVRAPYRALELQTGQATLTLWFVWWDNWRPLAGVLAERGYGDLAEYVRP
jgi:hypothetical protein